MRAAHAAVAMTVGRLAMSSTTLAVLLSLLTSVLAQDATPFDPAQLKTIPLSVITNQLASSYNVLIGDGRDQYLAASAKIDPNVRRLALLELLANYWGAKERSESLYTFFYFDCAAVAPEVADALRGAGLERESQIFSEAMALFGPAYPMDSKQRQQFFASVPCCDDSKLPAFDRRMMALSEGFGTYPQYRAAIERYVRANPRLSDYVERARDGFDRQWRLFWLTEQLRKRVLLEGTPAELLHSLDALPKPYRIVAILTIFRGQYYDDGVAQFFSTAAGAVALEVPAALRDVGLSEDAETLERAIAALPTPYPADRQTREDFMRQHGVFWDKSLDKLMVDHNNPMTRQIISFAEREGILPR